MNFDGPWSWRATRQVKRERTPEEDAYSERVRSNKRRAANLARNRRETTQRRAAKARNDAPIF